MKELTPPQKSEEFFQMRTPEGFEISMCSHSIKAPELMQDCIDYFEYWEKNHKPIKEKVKGHYVN